MVTYVRAFVQGVLTLYTYLPTSYYMMHFVITCPYSHKPLGIFNASNFQICPSVSDGLIKAVLGLAMLKVGFVAKNL